MRSLLTKILPGWDAPKLNQPGRHLAHAIGWTLLALSTLPLALGASAALAARLTEGYHVSLEASRMASFVARHVELALLPLSFAIPFGALVLLLGRRSKVSRPGDLYRYEYKYRA